MLSKVYAYLVSGKEKALVAGVVGAVGAYLTQNGLTLKDVLSKAGFHALVVGVVAHLLVYFTTNSSAK